VNNLLFDKVFVINLISEVNRRKNMENSMKLLNIDFEFVEAVSYKDIDIPELERNKEIAYKNNKFYCKKSCTCKGAGHSLRPTSIANLLSHSIAWDIAFRKNINILILEDDVKINKEYFKLLNEYQKDIPKNWDVIYFSKNGAQNYKKKFNRVTTGMSGSHMYAISSYAAGVALENLYPFRAHVDGYLDRFLIRKTNFFTLPKLKKCYITGDKFGINTSYDEDVKTTMIDFN
jgi:GR25 family glycosyltransferase involved in LPS biosynthesis